LTGTKATITPKCDNTGLSAKEAPLVYLYAKQYEENSVVGGGGR